MKAQKKNGSFLFGLLHRISLVLILLMGLAHLAATPTIPFPHSSAQLYFGGTGLAVVFIALLNWVVARTPGHSRSTKSILYGANLIYFGYIVILATTLKQPQLFIACILAFIMTVSAPSGTLN